MQNILGNHASERLRTGFAQTTLMQEYDKAGTKYYQKSNCFKIYN